MLHLLNKDFRPKDASSLLRQARDLCKGMNVTVRDSRVSSRFLEFDVSVTKDNLAILTKLLSPLGSLDNAKHIVEDEIEKEKAIEAGISYFNDERFWECHEVFEGVWKNCFEGEKDLVQGIILVAAALVHYQKYENDICLSILERAQKKLANSTGLYHQIDIDKLRERITEIKNSGKILTFKI